MLISWTNMVKSLKKKLQKCHETSQPTSLVVSGRKDTYKNGGETDAFSVPDVNVDCT